MDEWNFKRVGIEDQKLIEEYFRKYPERSCDRTFSGCCSGEDITI